MNIESQARQRLAQDRQDSQNLQDNLVERAEEEIRANSPDSGLEEDARELLSESRHHEEHLTQTMSERTTEELHSSS
jgi:hypothetical protein